MPPEVLSVEQARAANLGGALGDTALEEAILEEEQWLRRRIGPLTGERTQRFALAGLRPGSSEVHLRRPTDEVVVELVDEEGTATDISTTVELRGNGWVVAQLPNGTRYDVAVEATYVPTDELEVRRALRSLLALSTSEQASPGMASEQLGSYAYQRAAGASTKLRQQIVHELREPAQAKSLRMRSSVPHGVSGRLDR
jgi:hypothetical protein